MSLKIWLPLDGDLHNQGCSNVTIINNGATINTNGKIGNCYYFNASSYLYENTYNWTDFNTSQFSLCCWYKQPSPVASGNSQMICIGTSSGWNNIRIGLLRRTSNGYPMFSVSNGSSAVSYNCTATTFSLDTWNHIACTYDNGTIKIYLNGTLDKTYTTTIVPVLNSSQHLGIGAASNGAEKLTGYLNDVRIYDHALSAAEVKEISQGLVLHYKLNQPIGLTDAILNQDTYIVYNNYSGSGTTGTLTNLSETFNGHVVRREVMTPNDTSVNNFRTSLGSHGVYGHRQTFLANTKYVFWIYYRPISHTDIRAGGTASNIGGWIEIPPVAVGNGWYRVGQYRNGTVTTDKTDNIFTSFYTPTAASGVPITVDWAAPHLLVGTTEIPDDDLFMGNDYVKDSSGYNHNGTITGNIILNSNTPRYSASSLFNGTERITTTTPGADVRTLSCWCKTTKNKSTSQQMVADSFSNMTISFYNGTIIGVFGTTRGTGSKCTLGDSYKENDWNHIVVVKTDDAGARDIYCNGVKLTPTSNDYWSAATGFFVGARNTSNGNPFYGQISDVRAYCTALSADDILQLYHTSAKIDNNHNFHTFELVEKNQNKISINKRGQTLCEEIIEDTTTKFYKNTKTIETKQLIEI